MGRILRCIQDAMIAKGISPFDEIRCRRQSKKVSNLKFNDWGRKPINPAKVSNLKFKDCRRKPINPAIASDVIVDEAALNGSRSGTQNPEIACNDVVNEATLKELERDVAGLKKILDEKNSTFQSLKMSFEKKCNELEAERKELLISLERKKEKRSALHYLLNIMNNSIDEQVGEKRDHLISVENRYNFASRELVRMEQEIKKYTEIPVCRDHEKDTHKYVKLTKLYKNEVRYNSKESESLMQKILKLEKDIADLGRPIAKSTAIIEALKKELQRVQDYKIKATDETGYEVVNLIKKVEEDFEKNLAG